MAVIERLILIAVRVRGLVKVFPEAAALRFVKLGWRHVPGVRLGCLRRNAAENFQRQFLEQAARVLVAFLSAARLRRKLRDDGLGDFAE